MYWRCIWQFLDVTKSRDGDGMEPDAKRARTGAYLGLTRQKPPAVSKGQEEPVAQELRTGQGEEEIPGDEVQGKDNDGATRNGLEVDNLAPGGDSAVGGIKQQEFHLVKLARNGMVYISIPSCSSGDLVTFMSRVLKDFHTRSRAAPRYFCRHSQKTSNVRMRLWASVIRRQDVRLKSDWNHQFAYLFDDA